MVFCAFGSWIIPFKNKNIFRFGDRRIKLLPLYLSDSEKKNSSNYNVVHRDHMKRKTYNFSQS